MDQPVDDARVAVHRSSLARGGFVADYYTSQPACTQWIAVGVVSPRPARGVGAPVPRLLVGIGRTEWAAIRDLAGRLACLALAPQPACPAPPASTAVTARPSDVAGPLEGHRPGPQRSLSARSAAVQGAVSGLGT